MNLKLLGLLRFVGGGLLSMCALVMVRGKGFSVMGIPNPHTGVCFLVGSLMLLVSYLVQPKGPALKFRIANLVLMGVSLGITLGISEYGIRIYLQKTQGFNSVQQMFNPNPVGNLPTRSHHPLLVITQLSADKRLIYELKPHVNMSFGHNVLRTNSAGIREDKEYPFEKPAGTVRIIGLGDSGMWGWSLDQGQAYLDVMERELASQAGLPRVEVLNFAVPGYNTFQELQTLKQKSLAYQPDIVVIGWCSNDYQVPFFMYTRRDHMKEPGSYIYSLLLERRSFMEKVTPEVLKLGDMPEGSVDADVLAYSGEKGVRKCLQEFSELSREHGFKIVLFGPLDQTILTLCEEEGVPTINTYALKEQNPPEECLTFYMHPRACGHEILGDYLAEALTEKGWLESL
jgi:lysophospholipase L1-like esterase